MASEHQTLATKLDILADRLASIASEFILADRGVAGRLGRDQRVRRMRMVLPHLESSVAELAGCELADVQAVVDEIMAADQDPERWDGMA
jgi:hypothetical protein